MAAMASTRFLVQSSRASTRLKGSSPRLSVSSGGGGGGRFHTYSRHEPKRAALSKDLSFLAALESRSTHKTNGESAESWSSWELMASTMLAVAVTGSFIMGSTTMTSPTFSPGKIIHRGGGGGGSGGSGSGGSPIPLEKKSEEKSDVVAMADEEGGDSYQVRRLIFRIFLNGSSGF